MYINLAVVLPILRVKNVQQVVQACSDRLTDCLVVWLTALLDSLGLFSYPTPLLRSACPSTSFATAKGTLDKVMYRN